HDFILRFDVTEGFQRRNRSSRCAPFGRCKYPTQSTHEQYVFRHVLVAYGNRCATRLAHSVQNQEIANCTCYPQTRSIGMRVLLPGRGFFLLLPGAHHWRAASRLYDVHARPLTADPAKLLHLVKCFPHADESGTAARRVNDRIGQSTTELLEHLV